MSKTKSADRAASDPSGVNSPKTNTFLICQALHWQLATVQATGGAKPFLFNSFLARFSLIAAGVLLLANPFVPLELHGWLSAAPLLLAGAGYGLLQIRLNPPRGELLKRLLLAAAFIGWGIDQLLPAGRASLFLGDAVIAAYVLDLFWIAATQQRNEAPARSAQDLLP